MEICSKYVLFSCLNKDATSMEALNTGFQQASATIYHAQHIISMLLTCRNASPMLLVAKLPDDTPAMIFCEASRHDPAAMFAISQTCSHWRRLALHTPKMWAIVDLKAWDPNYEYCSHKTLHLELMRSVFTRSAATEKTTLLAGVFWGVFCYAISGYLYTESLNIIHDCLVHLVDLNISITPEDLMQISWLEDLPAPTLRSLSIRVKQEVDFCPLTVRKLFAGNAPHLKYVRLFGFRVAWDLDTFPRNLQTLIIDEDFDMRQFPDEEDEDEVRLDHPRFAHDDSITSILQLSPDLEVLTLSRCSNLRCGYSGQAIDPISLPKLRRLTL